MRVRQSAIQTSDASIELGHVVAQVAEIDCIANGLRAFVKAQAERCWTAVRLVDEAHAGVSEAKLLLELARLGDRPIEVGLREHIGEPQFELV